MTASLLVSEVVCVSVSLNLYEKGHRVMLKHSMLYCTDVNSSSISRCYAINGILMQTNATEMQRGNKIVCVWCSVLWWYCCVPRDGLCKNDITRTCCNRCAVESGVMMDVDQRVCECKAPRMLVSVCLLSKLFLPDVTCYSNCKCVWKWICKEYYKVNT